MWLGPHFAFSVLQRDALAREPRGIRWPLIVIGAFFSHWLLDSTGVAHTLERMLLWQQALIISWNTLWVGTIIWRCRRRQHWGYILAGLIGWLIWDIEWLFVPGGGYGWIHQLKKLTTMGGEIPFPGGAILEFCWMAILAAISLPTLRRGWR